MVKAKYTTLQTEKGVVAYPKTSVKAVKDFDKGKTQKDIVKIFLDERRKSNLKLAQKYPENAMGKSFDDCWAYIEDNAEKAANGQNRVAITSFTVFDWAVNYFCDDSIAKVEKAKSTTSKPTKEEKPTKSELQTLQEAKEIWQKKNDQQVAQWEQENNAAIDKFEKEHAMDLFPPVNPYLNKENPYLNAVFPQQEKLDKLLAVQQ